MAYRQLWVMTHRRACPVSGYGVLAHPDGETCGPCPQCGAKMVSYSLTSELEEAQRAHRNTAERLDIVLGLARPVIQEISKHPEWRKFLRRTSSVFLDEFLATAKEPTQ